MQVRYMNVWRSTSGDHQWTDGEGGLGDRDFVDTVARIIAKDSHVTGIHRMAVLRVRLKEQPA